VAAKAEIWSVCLQRRSVGDRFRTVPINEWWVDDPAQKYWMEITDREDLGGDLRAPQVADDGNPEWGYATSPRSRHL
jgi:hypothetical protein